MRLQATEREKKILVKKFKSLTIPEQFDFWEKNLHRPYLFFLCIMSPFYKYAGTPKQDETVEQFKAFVIHPSPYQYHAYNRKLIEQYNRYCRRLNLPKLWDINQLKDGYFEKLKNSSSAKSKESLIDEQIRLIDDYIGKQEQHQKEDAHDSRLFYFLFGYRQKFLSDKEPDLESQLYEFCDLVSLLNGSTIAAFKTFLKDEIKNKRTGQDTKEFTLKQKLIALHYQGEALDIIMDAKNATKQSEFLHSMWGNSSQNIREEFSTIHDLIFPRSEVDRRAAKENLQVVQSAFKNLIARPDGFTHDLILSVLQKIDIDLQKLDKY